MCMDIEVNDCCCFVDLKTGCFIIGYTGLMLCGSSILYAVYALFLSTPPDNTSEDHILNIVMQILCYAILVLCGLHFIFSSCLVLGVHKNSRGWIKAFIVYLNIFIGYQIISFVYSIFTFNVIGLLVNVPFIILLLYILGVVNSYHKELGNKPTPAVIYPATDPAVSNCTPNNTATMAVNYPATGPVGYGSPSDVYTAAATGPVNYGAPNYGYTSAVTGPVSHGAPNYEYTSAVTGPVNHGAPNNGYSSAVTGPVSHGVPNNGYTEAVTSPVNYGAHTYEHTASATAPVQQ